MANREHAYLSKRRLYQSLWEAISMLYDTDYYQIQSVVVTASCSGSRIQYKCNFLSPNISESYLLLPISLCWSMPCRTNKNASKCRECILFCVRLLLSDASVMSFAPSSQWTMWPWRWDHDYGSKLATIFSFFFYKSISRQVFGSSSLDHVLPLQYFKFTPSMWPSPEIPWVKQIAHAFHQSSHTEIKHPYMSAQIRETRCSGGYQEWTSWYKTLILLLHRTSIHVCMRWLLCR